MRNRISISQHTRNNWLIDCILFIGAVVASISGIYFLFLPVGGYQGGRNPQYGIRILFLRETWKDLHTWFGILMIVSAVIHIFIHWKWILSMTKRVTGEFFRRENRINARSRFNIGINTLIGLSFLITAVSGIYLLFFPGGSYGIADPIFLFRRTTWDLIHTWAGIVMIISAAVHFTIHWRWIAKVTIKMFRSIKPDSTSEMIAEPVQ